MKKRSQFLKLNQRDFLKGLVVAVLTAVIVTVQQQLQADVFDWKIVATTALSALLAYLSKNLLENEKGEFGKASGN